MTFEQFEEGAGLTWGDPHELGSVEGLATVAMGLSGESGEFTDTVKKLYAQGHQYDESAREKLIEELGDILYYVAMGAISLKIELEELAIRNNAKLAARYEGGFSSEKSRQRRIPG